MKKILFAGAGVALESLGWVAGLILCREFVEKAAQNRLGERYFETYGRAAHPWLALYFLAIFLLFTILFTGGALLANRLTRLKAGEVVALLTLVNLLWLGVLIFGYVLQRVFVI